MNKIVIINWKINVNYAQMSEFVSRLDQKDSGSLIVLPSHIGLFLFSTIKQNKIQSSQLGFQYVNSFPRGNYTGDVSYLEAKETGINYILVNHNEVLAHRSWNKKYETQNENIKKLLDNEMVPIICIGNDIKESFEDFDKLIKNEIVKLFNEVKFLPNSKFILNYMPYFIVKNSIILSNKEIEQQINIIKQLMLEVFDEFVVETCIKIVYGGKLSENKALPENVDGFYIDEGHNFNYVYNILFLNRDKENLVFEETETNNIEIEKN